MSKSQSAIVGLLLIVLVAFTGFLAWQVSELRSEHGRLSARAQGQTAHDEKLAAEVADLKKKLETQAETLKEFGSQMAGLPAALKDDLRKEFVPHPEYVSAKPLFISKAGEGGFLVTGDLSALDAWMDRNKLFLDYVVQESLVLDVDAKTQKIVVTDIIPDSVFYQMGLRKGDLVLTVNGQAVLDGEELRMNLMEAVPVKIGVSRGDEKVTLDVSYVASDPDRVALNLTEGEFRAVVPKLLETLKIVPVAEDGVVAGVRIVDVQPVNVFSLLNFRNGDVITKIGGEPVTMSGFLDALRGAKSPLALDYIRDGEAKNVTAAFLE